MIAEEESCDQVHAGKWFSCCLLLFQHRSIRGTDFSSCVEDMQMYSINDEIMSVCVCV